MDNGPLKRFLSLHGLGLIWSWMVELTDLTSKEALELKQDVSIILVPRGPTMWAGLTD